MTAPKTARTRRDTTSPMRARAALLSGLSGGPLRGAACALLFAIGCGPLLGLDDDPRLIEGSGGDTGCASDADCDDDNPCSLDVCRAEGRCQHGIVGDGFAPEQVNGDCARISCSAGQADVVPDDDDIPAATDCDEPTCDAGAIVPHPISLGASCDDGGRFCNGAGSCVDCLADSDCELPETCGGGSEAQTCGCTPLACADLGVSCGLVSDTCFDVINCNDVTLNGDETDIDCGGKTATCFARCGHGQICEHGDDCASAFCGGGSCDDPWSDGFGAAGQQQVAALAVGPDGSIVLTGSYTGTIDFGGGALPNAQSPAMFVAKLDPLGAHVFSNAYPAGAPRDVAVDSSGNLLLVGSFAGSLDFGIGALVSGVERSFVVKLDGSGNALWQRDIGGGPTSTSQLRAVSTNASNEVVLAGGFTGDITVDNTPVAEAGGGDIFLMRLNTAGGTLFARTFGDPGTDVVEDVASAADGSFAVAGHFSGTIDFGGNAITSKGGFDVFVARLNPGGTVVQAASFGGTGPQLASGVAFDGSDVVLVGSFTGELTGLGATLWSNGGFDLFAIKLREGLTVEWAESFGSNQDDYTHALSADPFGGVVVTGGFQGQMPVGPTTLVSLGGFDVFVIKLDSDGGVLLSHAYGDSQEDTVRDVDVSDFGTVVLTGEFRGTIDFGQGPIPSQGADDVFVAAL